MNIDQTVSRILLLFFLLGGWCPCAHGQIPRDTLFVADQNAYQLNRYLYVYKTDKHITPTFLTDSIKTQKFKRLYPQEALNEGFSKNSFWMAFTVKNVTSDAKDLYLQFNNPNLNIVQLYRVNDTGYKTLYLTGITYPFNSRPYIYYDFVFPIKLLRGEAVTYLIKTNKKDEIFSIKPVLLGDKKFKKQEEKHYIVMGVMMGIMIFNIIINLFLWLSLKAKIHLLYTFYILSTMLWLFSSMGLDFQFIFPNHPGMYAISQPITGGITMVLMAQLAIYFLGLTYRNSKVKRLLNLAKTIVLLQIPLWYVVYYWLPDIAWIRQLQSDLFIAAISTIAICLVIAAIERIRQGYRPAWFYLIAMTYLATGIFKTCYIILNSADISGIVTPPTDVQIGLIVESIIIFMGIIYRYNLFKKEKETLTQQLLLQQQVTTQQIITAQEEERKRIAQDLHDDVGATLSTLLLHISHIPEDSSDRIESNKKHNERSIAISKKALSDLLLISHDLLPKDFASLGIFQVLKMRIDELNVVGNIHFNLLTEGDDKTLHSIKAIILYLIINELISNVIKHSLASSSCLQLIINEECTSVMLLLEDNGVGLSKSNGNEGIGLKNIYSRVEFLKGKITIDSNNKGTTTIIEIPIN